jgi:hypothetical protein
MSKDCSVCLDKGELPIVDRPCPIHNSRGRKISKKSIFIFSRKESGKEGWADPQRTLSQCATRRQSVDIDSGERSSRRPCCVLTAEPCLLRPCNYFVLVVSCLTCMMEMYVARGAYMCEATGWCSGLNIRISPPQFRLHKRVGDQPGPPRGCKVPRMQVGHSAQQTHQLAAATIAHAEADEISPTAGNRSGSYSRTARTGGRRRRLNYRPRSQEMGIRTARHEVSLSPILPASRTNTHFHTPARSWARGCRIARKCGVLPLLRSGVDS